MTQNTAAGAGAGAKPLRIFFHAPGIAAHRPKPSLPVITGAQTTAADRISGIYPNHMLTGNRGNIIHAEAPAKLFQKSETGSAYGNLAQLLHRLGPSYAARVARSFDLVIISMANFIRPDHDGTRLVDALKALEQRVPVVVLGAGLQGHHALSDMMPSNRDLIDWFNQNAVIFGVRGDRTANWLHDNGFKNTEVMGCPSLHTYPHSLLDMDPRPALAKGTDLSVMTAGYVKLLDGTLHPRGDELMRAFRRIRASYVFQDEPFTMTELADAPALYNEGNNEFRTAAMNAWLSRQAGRPVGFQRYYYFHEAGAWRQAALRHDVYIGDRFHCGVAAIQAGVPAIFLSHDNRVAEMTDHFGLPRLTTRNFARKGLAAVMEEYLAPERVHRMKQLYLQRRAEFFAVTARVGLMPALHDLDLPEAPRPAPAAPLPLRLRLRRLARRFR